MCGRHACVEEQEIKPQIALSLLLYLYDERKKTATHGEPVTPTLTQLPSLSITTGYPVPCESKHPLSLIVRDPKTNWLQWVRHQQQSKAG